MLERPLWGSRRRVQALFDLSESQLRALVVRHAVRSVKMGGAQQCRRVFNLEDIRDAMIAMGGQDAIRDYGEPIADRSVGAR